MWELLLPQLTDAFGLEISKDGACTSEFASCLESLIVDLAKKISKINEVHENLRKTAHHKANRCSRHHRWRGRQQRCSLLCQELCPFHLCGEVTWTKPQLEVGNG